ncbi:MAG TPA: PAS domain-containing protein [Octadecabacter sp.]|nr:PAS domain-containing protein [Octadecabacter sp.]
MSMTFDPYKVPANAISEAQDVIMTNPTALKELENYWAALPRSNGVPHRKHVDPIAMGALLEDSFILERVAPGVARIRVAGRNITKLIGVEPRGLPLTAIMLPEARPDIAKYLEQVFMTPSIVEIPLIGPRAVGQPKLHGKILLLPLRDDHGRVSRILGLLVMSGRRGLGGRRFTIVSDKAARVDAVVGLHAVPGGKTKTHCPTFRVPYHEKAEDKPALRLVVSND